jgi:uncharacterized protein YyaL (SSP411 family)
MYIETAQRAAAFIQGTLWDAERRVLLRRYRDGEAGIDAYCEDYACLVWGLLELFQADGNPEWLAWAVDLQLRQDELFWDDVDGGWFNTTGADPTVLLRLKEEYDGAEPSPISVSAQNLLWLAHLTGDDEHGRRAERALARLSGRGADAARISPFMMAALSLRHAGLEQAVIVGDPGREDTRSLHGVLSRHYRPSTIVVPVTPGERQQAVAALLPFVADMRAHEGRATAYLCRNFTCEAPVSDAAEWAEQLATA